MSATSSPPTPVEQTTPKQMPLQPVTGPSALAGGRRRFMDLLWLMAVTEFKRTYFGTVLGYLWSLMRPLLQFGVLLFVFTKIIKLGGISDYPVVLLLNIVLFTFFQEATLNSVTSVVAQEGIVRRTQFPRLVIPFSVVLTAMFQLTLNLMVVFIFIVAWGVDPKWTWLLFPPCLAVMLIFTTALASLLSVLYVRFRDVLIIWTVMAQVLIYATPVIYTLEFLHGTALHIISLNPLAPLFQQIQDWVISPTVTSTDSNGVTTEHTLYSAPHAIGGAIWLLPALAIFIGVCVFAAWIFNHDAPRIAEDL
jgi:ABC-2 type transport system permease protein